MKPEEKLAAEKALYERLVRKQSIFPEGSAEHRLFDYMINEMWGWGDEVPSERVLYIRAVEDLEYKPRNSIVASQVMPDSVKKEIFDQCEHGGCAFVNGHLVGPEMIAIVGGSAGSDHRGLIPGAAEKKAESQKQSPYTFETKDKPVDKPVDRLERILMSDNFIRDTASNHYGLSNKGYL